MLPTRRSHSSSGIRSGRAAAMSREPVGIKPVLDKRALMTEGFGHGAEQPCVPISDLELEPLGTFAHKAIQIR